MKKNLALPDITPILYLIIIFAFFFINFCCIKSYGQSEPIKVDTTKAVIIRIDPHQAIGGSASDIFSEIDYVPLETNAESTFGSVSQLEVTDQYYIILDYNTNSILLFDKVGKFHRKIKGKMGIPIWSFSLDRWSNCIVYSDDQFSSIKHVNYNGETVKTLDLKSSSLVALFNLNFQFIAPDRIISYDQYRNIARKSKYYVDFSRSLLRYATDEGTLLDKIFPYSDKESKIDVLSSSVKTFNYFGDKSTYFFSKPYDYSIYSVTSDSVALSYQFIFPLKKSLPSDFLMNSSYDAHRNDFIRKNNTLIYGISNSYRLGNCLFFKTSIFSSTKEDNLIYSLRTGATYAFKHITPDETSCSLPLYDDATTDFDNYGFSACDGTYIYGTLSSLCMFKYFEARKEPASDYRSPLSAYFASGSRKSNPVIIRLRPSSDI